MWKRHKDTQYNQALLGHWELYHKLRTKHEITYNASNSNRVNTLPQQPEGIYILLAKS